ncbi:MAG: TlpA disulfide reductase family protein [Bacteroidota bacterium]|nr:TlpA disulfide reductase family protein [Bacteroidota bacterium]
MKLDMRKCGMLLLFVSSLVLIQACTPDKPSESGIMGNNTSSSGTESQSKINSKTDSVGEETVLPKDNKGRIILPSDPTLKPDDPRYLKTEGVLEPFQVQGKLRGGARGVLVVYQVGIGIDVKPMLSQVVNPDETFGFSGLADQPQMIALKTPNGAINLIVRPGDIINLDMTLEDPGQFKVNGSIETAQLDTMYVILNDANLKKEAVEARIKALQDKAMDAPDNDTRTKYQRLMGKELEKRNDLFNKYDLEKQANLQKLINRVDTSFVGLVASLYLNNQTYGEYLIALEKKYRIYKYSVFHKTLKEKISEFSPYLIGKIAPAFRVEQQDGRSLSLSDYRGKYVLLDFWASWCGPCRLQNPQLIKLNTKYSNKNFALVSISLDSRKEDWIKAIKDDKMTWINGSDLLGNQGVIGQTYGPVLTFIPANFLIDPNGRILGRNLFGKELETQLAKYFK